MNDTNLENLKKDQKEIGFGTRLNDVLERAIRKEMPAFMLSKENTFHDPWVPEKERTPANADYMEYRLNYAKAKDSDTYYRNSFDLILDKAGEPKPRQRNFDSQYDHGVTAIEAYKLLSGVSLLKPILSAEDRKRDDWKANPPQRIPVWLKLDLTVRDAYGKHPLNTYYPQYKFDVMETYAKYKPEDLNKPELLEKAKKELEKGNYWSTTIPVDGKKTPVFLAADAEFKSMIVRDQKGIVIPNEVIFPDQKKSKGTTVEAEAEAGPGWKPEQVPENTSRSRGR